MSGSGRRALITGAAGFVGHHLSQHLIHRGWEVLCSDVRAPEAKDRWFACDVSSEQSVKDLIGWAGELTHVFHLAAITFVPESKRNPAQTFAVNMVGTAHLVHALADRRSARLVFIGSSDSYGRPESLPVVESHPLHPENPYAISKAAADHFCAWAGETLGLDIVRMRPFNHSGRGQSDQFVLSAFARQLARIEAGKQPPEIRVGNLESARDFSHVKDIVRGYESAAIHGKQGHAYNICSGCSVKISDALDALIRLSRAKVTVTVDKERFRAGEATTNYGSHEKLTRDTQWRPEIPFEQVLSDLLEYWREQENT